MSRIRVVDREKLVLSLVRNRCVLDIGCADNLHLEKKLREDTWLHGKISRAAARCVGVDRDGACVRQLQDRGYNVRVGDAEGLSLGEEFDVIVAGEIIEHVFNVGLFLDSARRHLAPEGILLVTTPNALALIDRSWIKPFRRTEPNPTHVATYCRATLRQLLTLKGFRILGEGFCASSSSTWVKAVSRRIAYRLRPEWAETLYVVCAVR